jgi:uncharacterized protein YjdB
MIKALLVGVPQFATMGVLMASLFPSCESPAAVKREQLPPPAVTVTVSPSVHEVAVGLTRTFTAQVGGGNDATLRTVTWSAQPAEGIVALTAEGNSVVVRGVAAGSANVIATHTSGVSGAAEIRVLGR